jgi:hypothetical protein
VFLLRFFDTIEHELEQVAFVLGRHMGSESVRLFDFSVYRLWQQQTAIAATPRSMANMCREKSE